MELYQEIVAKGFTGSLDLVQRFVGTWREQPRVESMVGTRRLSYRRAIIWRSF
ncbi:MAG: hypothetical protein V4671_15525 [Armatimonadota bacterium]